MVNDIQRYFMNLKKRKLIINFNIVGIEYNFFNIKSSF